MDADEFSQIFNWPVVSKEILWAGCSQILKSVSIYDEGGVYGDFERKFASYVGHEFAICTSSGTAALHSAFYALGLKGDDEIIACDYGFFGTAAPAVYLGVSVRFVDCGIDGCIEVSRVVSAITSRTKAIVVTHMWGAAAAVHQLRSICDEYGLVLIEDCSHAHGTTAEGKIVGSLGDVGVWSLQAKKPLWAGEGGVLCTSKRDVFERALLLGHFNLRALNQISESSVNRKFAFTGTGLKYRAHPVGIAMALRQLPRLNDVIDGRQAVADLWAQALECCGYLRVISVSKDRSRHSYYSLVAVLPDCWPEGSNRKLAQKLKESGIRGAGVPKQMGSISGFPLFRQRESGNDDFRNSKRISANCINLFVPSYDSPGVCSDKIKKCADIIARVGIEFPSSG